MNPLVATSILVAVMAGRGETKVSVVKQLDPTPGYKLSTGNRPPLRPSPLVKLPVGSVRPLGWLRRQLELEADGFTGKLHQLSRFLGEDGNAWLDPTGEGEKSFWEELPYWLKGYGDLAYLLGDERMIREARRWIEAALASQREDGYFGPRRNLTYVHGKPDLWPNMIMLDVLRSYYEYSGDRRVLELAGRYFRWELAQPEADFLLPFWQQQRAADNLSAVYWYYNITGEPWLLPLGEKIHRHTANWTDGVANWHGVNISQSFRGPAVYFQQAKDAKYLAATESDYQEVRRLYGQVPGGLYGADENCRPGYTDPRQATETCTMAEMMLSDELLLKISGNLVWADRCEDVAFNSLPASMTADMKSLRYLTAPNMVLSDRKSKSPGLQNSGAMLLFDPRSHRCCQHNVSHAWPYFVEHLWMAAPGDGLAAVMYGPCQVTAKVGGGTAVTIHEETRYPFEETVRLTLSMDAPTRFPLALRVPGWAAAVSLTVAGQPVPVDAKPGSYVVLDRTWRDRDRLELALPMKITLATWKENKDAVSVYRGPLCFSVKIGEKSVRVGGTDDWPALEIHPTTPWNYGLVLAAGDPAAGIEVVPRPWPGDNQPFRSDAAPIELRAKARKIPQWKLDFLGLVGPLCPSPVKSQEPEETISLIPMGCARLRIASIPTIGQGPNARPWSEPPTRAPHEASHCCDGDSVMALSDGRVPRSSADRHLPRFTWWPRRGSTEWVTYDFPARRTVGQAEVYWYDDTGHGHCRPPKSWRLEWFDGNRWQPVETSTPYGVGIDRFNVVRFHPVQAARLRITAELQPTFSAGILEWCIR
jgi:hypothetical protein